MGATSRSCCRDEHGGDQYLSMRQTERLAETDVPAGRARLGRVGGMNADPTPSRWRSGGLGWGVVQAQR
ncbi:MAG: hypothetical protein JW751_29535, partial [Polyangiaceae bacterium]|nr:hypothetical protein [Polyangiaceae bacterium]